MRLTLPVVLLSLASIITAQSYPSPTPPTEAELCYAECYEAGMVPCPDPEVYRHEWCMCRNNVRYECSRECGTKPTRPEMCRPNMSTMTDADRPEATEV